MSNRAGKRRLQGRLWTEQTRVPGLRDVAVFAVDLQEKVLRQLTGHGIVEARDAEGREFGRDHFVDFIVRHHSGHQTLHETLRRLMHAVVEHHAGHLDDDATVLLAEWRVGHQDKLMP
ncbi:SpoIIE family protein phosphatase [Streptomyces sp. NPDC001797]|uniref:SpoIIE family protein phosphatase n=1 Tax=Streptomyces sp. NPDC001797 TaxID=3364610 RepID=UPI0036A8E009